MLNEQQVQRGVRVRVLADLPHVQMKAGTVGEIIEVRRDVRAGYWGFYIAWQVSPSRTNTSLRLTREDLRCLEAADDQVEPQASAASHGTRRAVDRLGLS